MTFGAGIWWTDEPDEPSDGGVRNVGYVIWSETGSGKYDRIDIEVEVPVGWKPKNINNILKNEYLSLPIFICPHEIKIILPTEEERVISL
jgi:hypothetical protein